MARTSGNRQKHESSNPVQAWLIRRFHERVVDLVDHVGPSSVLEVGCGEGYVLAAIHEARPDVDLHGVDLSAPAIAEARDRLPAEVDLRVADATALGDAEPAHDLVMMVEVLEHLDDPAAMLADLGTLTTGHILLTVPWEPFFRLSNLLRLRNVRDWGNDPEHVNHWGGRAFRRFVASRFTVVEARQSFPWTIVLAHR
jgi:2-polyprenyl-3-methyl-5-hydroxy-6-metoxy-1,4-benzoquinol methylase